MALHNVYSKELSNAFGRGHPIANPQPVDYGDEDGEPLRPVDIGDVGYIQPALGYFVRLFNVHLEPGVQGQPTSDRLPDDFQPLRKYRVMFTKDTTPVFVSRSVTTKKLNAAASGPFFGGFAEFSTSSDRGAILATPDPIECYNAIHILSYKEHFKVNIQSWHEFALAEGHNIALDDLMLVTGVDRTTSWANAFFSDTGLEAGFGLEVQFANVGVGLKLACQYSWQSTLGALVNSGPAPLSPSQSLSQHSGISGGSASEIRINRDEGRQPINVTSNQSLFIRHVRAKRRRWLGLKIKAEGEKDEDDSDSEPDDGFTGGDIIVTNTPERQKFEDCLEPALDYILEHSDSDIAVAHDEDLDLLSAIGSTGTGPPIIVENGAGMFSSNDTAAIDVNPDLVCSVCDYALIGPYFIACGRKYHVEHFTCSVCPTVFGPQDSYYEHEGDVFCHYHYSVLRAIKCAGCDTAVLKQFVELQRNMHVECWHPECYMINKHWNVKIASKEPKNVSPTPAEGQEQPWSREMAETFMERQVRMEQRACRMWTVLSAFDGSCAAYINDMLRQVSNGQYLEVIRMAEKFIIHVEVLFATLDDLEFAFARLNLKSPSHIREARLLCRKIVDLFTLLSHTQETGARRMGMPQELLALVTGLAHYLKILIRIGLTSALKLEREHGRSDAMSTFLDKLQLLAMQGGNPGARRILDPGQRERGAITASSDTVTIEPVQQQLGVNAGTAGVTYGFRSLAPESIGESPFGGAPRDPALANVPVVNPPSDLCMRCGLTVEEDCVRLGTYQRWHSACITCKICGKAAAAPAPAPPTFADQDDPPKISSSRRPPANAHLFVYDPESQPIDIFCTEHRGPGFRTGFVAVSRLEQYAFLLNVALRRLYLLLKKRRVITGQPSPAPAPPPAVQDDPYRNSAETMRMKTAHLDRKLSATARLPKRSTVVESPSGRMAQPTDFVTSTRGASSHAQATAQSAQQYGQAQQYAQPQQSQVALQHAPSHPGAGQSAEMHARSQAQTHMHPPQQAHHPQLVQTQNLPSSQQQLQQQKRTLPGDRPALSRKNTDVMIVDDPLPAPASPAETAPSNGGLPLQPVVAREGITLADIPQLAEAAQALEQHRALPRQRATPFIAELAPLELAIVKHAAVVILYRSALKDSLELDELLEMVEVRKGGFWGKLFKGSGGGAKGKAKKGGVFGVPLELLAEKEGADSLHGATRETLRVPSFIDDVVSAMRQMDMSVEGIFRKSGNIKRLNDIVESYDRDPASVDLTSDNPVQLAALLKRFLRELPDPLLTFRLHRLLILSQNTQSISDEAERRRLLHMLMLVLPKAHRDTLEVLFVFMKWVASFAHLDERTGSKMDLPNLATLICPSILYSQGNNALADDSSGAVRVVQALLENQDEYYTVPEELSGLLGDQTYFAGCVEMPGQEFMKKVETYMRLKASGQQLGAVTPLPVR